MVACGAQEKSMVSPANHPSANVTLPQEFGLIPPFRLTLSGSTAEGGKWISEIWYGGKAGSREDCLESVNVPNLSRGDFTVFNGKQKQVYHYWADTNSYQAPRTHPDFSMVRCMLWSDPKYPPGLSWKDRSIEPSVTPGPLIAGRATFHVHCESHDLWLDCETGLVLKSVDPTTIKEVTSIEYAPKFPQGIFKFVPPPGAYETE